MGPNRVIVGLPERLEKAKDQIALLEGSKSQWTESALRFGIEYAERCGEPSEAEIDALARWLTVYPTGTFDQWDQEQADAITS